MADEKIKVTLEVKKAQFHPAVSYLVPVSVLIKMEKDDFETSVKIPVGDEVSAKEFALAVKALFEASTVFYHQMYDRLREKMEELNKDFEKSSALLEKDQRGG